MPLGVGPGKVPGDEEHPMRKQKGFSLIELLIVVAIILIIAAIAIPNLLRARMAANDSAAAGSTRTINTAEVAYFDAYPSIGFPAALATLGGVSPCTAGPATGCLIDNYLATNGGGAGKSGYNFNATGSVGGGSLINNQYYATATPISAQYRNTSLLLGRGRGIAPPAGGHPHPGPQLRRLPSSLAHAIIRTSDGRNP